MATGASLLKNGGLCVSFTPPQLRLVGLAEHEDLLVQDAAEALSARERSAAAREFLDAARGAGGEAGGGAEGAATQRPMTTRRAAARLERKMAERAAEQEAARALSPARLRCSWRADALAAARRRRRPALRRRLRMRYCSRARWRREGLRRLRTPAQASGPAAWPLARLGW